MTRVKLLISSLICAIMLVDLAGCTTFETAIFEKQLPKATAADPVVQILCMWQQSEGSDPDGRPCRGFNGQILFLSRKKGIPVEVEGDVRIFLFDDKGTPEEQSKPIHQYNFDHGSWKIHLQKSSLGATYSVFVPYTRRDVTQADCSLRVRFKPKIGPVVLSDFSNMPLTGHKKPLRGDDAIPTPAEEVERLAAEAMAKNLLQSTTISSTANAKMKTEDSAAGDRPAASPIQLASHEVAAEAPKSAMDAARLRQLESMMQQMLANQINNPSPPERQYQPPRDLPLSIEEPARLTDETAGKSERFKLNSKPRSASDSDEPQRTESARKSHPLDDVDKEPVKSSRAEKGSRKRDSLDAEASRSDIETASVQAPQSEIRRYQRSVR